MIDLPVPMPVRIRYPESIVTQSNLGPDDERLADRRDTQSSAIT